jgi:hypothetical protein
VSLPGYSGEPPAGDSSGAFGTDVVATLSHLPEVINQGLQFGPFGCEEGFAVEDRGEDLTFVLISQYRINVR